MNDKKYVYLLSIPKELEKKIKQICLNQNLSIKDFILKAIENELEKETK